MNFISSKSRRKKLILAISFIILLVCISTVPGLAFNLSSYAPKSVLSSGNWVKIKVTETGVHKITQSDVAKWGFNDINKIRIFGYGGEQISEVLDNNTYIDDLPQIPISRIGNAIFFYGKGATSFEQIKLNGIKRRQVQHPYADAGYYFVTDGDAPDLLIESVQTPAEQSYEVNTFNEVLFHEKELFSAGQTGRTLLGEDFKYNSIQSFKFNFLDYVAGTEVTVLTSFGAKIKGGSGNLAFAQNGTNIKPTTEDKIGPNSSDEYEHIKMIQPVKSFPITDKNLTFTINLSYTGTLITARLDYITINYTRALKISNKKLNFKDGENHSTNVTYAVSGATSESVVWDVSTARKPVQIKYNLSNSVAKFSPTGSEREYAIFEPTATLETPIFVGKVNNQNLHAEDVPNMVIISPKEFISEAERVANLHRTSDKMSVLVVQHDLIFNEFSSGTPDAMAYRRLLKMFYDRGNANHDSQKLKYLLLFGRGSYDNRQITDKVKRSSYPMLLTWQTNTSNDDRSSYPCDDFFSFLEDGDKARAAIMRIATGRMVFTDINQAKTAVDKLYKYTTQKDYGSWKNHILAVADNEDGAVHMSQAERNIATMKKNGGSQYIFDHVYLDAFPAVSEGSGKVYPDARKKLFQKLYEGVLWVNYNGHGNTVSWTDNKLLTITDIKNNMFYSHYPLFFTATCTFTRWDSDDISAGELLFLNSRGGAIALMTASRPSEIGNNGTLTYFVSNQIFKKDSNGEFQRIGDILKNAKNDHATSEHTTTIHENNLLYILVGDPAMRLAYPTYKVVLETVNGENVNDENQPIIKAKEPVIITGSIYDESGNKDTNFNGTILPTLYDAEVSVETAELDQKGKKFIYYDRTNRLYIGKDSIKNGEFSLKFNMPSEIINNYSPAMFSFYAYNNDGAEGNGATENIYAYGYNDKIESDTEGPNIETLYLNSPSFKTGDTVNESPMVSARFNDMSGINLSSSGIGHQMAITIDGTNLHSDVAQYYTPDIGAKGGTINYPLSNLPKGKHTLQFKVWDTFNNSSERDIDFYVLPGLAPEIYDVYTTNNISSVEAEFFLKHNRPDAQVIITISVYDIAGRRVWSTTEKGRSDLFTSFPIVWNLCDDGGKRVTRGIYVYRATITTDGEQESTASRKIAVTGE